MDWFRAYHGTCTDPKLHKASRMAQVRRSVVLAAWLAVLETASKNSDRGMLGSFDADDLAFMIDESRAVAGRCLQAFIDLGMIADGGVAAWSKRQKISDDVKIRVKRHRERSGNPLENNETDPPGNVTETHYRTEQRRTDKKGTPNGVPKESPPPSVPVARTPKASRYTEQFEQLWRTYPRRDEDGKADCAKLWATAIKAAEPSAIIGAASLWHAEHHDNEFRIGLRRWLKGQKWLEPVPPRRRTQSGDFALNALRGLAQDMHRDNPDETDFGPVLEGACDGLPSSPAGGSANLVPLGGRGAGDVRSLHRRADPLFAPGGNGGLPPVGPAEAELAEPCRADRFH